MIQTDKLLQTVSFTIMPWEMIKKKLADILPENSMSLWISPLECQTSSEQVLELLAPDRFFAHGSKRIFSRRSEVVWMTWA